MFLVQSQGWIQFNRQVNWSVYTVGVVVAMAWIYYGLRGSRDRIGSMSFYEAARLTAQQLMRLMVVLFTLAFATKDVDVSRAFFAQFLAVTGVLLLTANYYLAPFLARLFFDRNRLRTIIVARKDEALRLESWIQSRGHLGFEAIGYVSPKGEPVSDDKRCLGSVDDLSAIMAERAVDQVVFARTERDREGMAKIIHDAESAHCRVRFFVDMVTLFGNATQTIEHNGHYSFATTMREPLENPLNRVMKRLLDIAVALPVVVFILPPLCAWVWFMQRLQSPGPVFYRQARSGLNKERFSILKFRTMHVNNGSQIAKQATVGDPRIYSFGRFLRRTSLDEIPQFLNVVFGSMSVSGPRPHLIEHDEQFARLERAYFKRHFVKPGITGLAQSMGFRGELVESSDLSNRILYDEIYVANWSIGMDVRILFKTAQQVIAPPRSAY